MPGRDDFDDEDPREIGGELDDIDAHELEEAVAAAASIGEEADIDAPPTSGSLAPHGAATPAPAAPQLADILAGNAPVFLVHKSYRQFRLIPQVLEVARHVTGGRIGLGTVVRLPKMKTSDARSFLDSCAHASMRIADPEVFTLPGSGSPAPTVSAAHIHEHPWAAGIPGPATPPADRDAWIADIFAAQRAAGANVLLSPTGWVTDTQGPAALQATLGQVAAARAVLGDEPMFVNLTLAGAWLSNTTLRQRLLDEIVESNERHWYIRVRWPIVDPRYGQLSDAGFLAGYRDLAETAELEGKVLVLPNSGLTGWVATALGAAGFSTGMSWTDQAFADEPRFGRRPGQASPPAAERYFERAMLHTVLWESARDLGSVPGYTPCQCRYCTSLQANGFDKERSGAHYLVRAARLLDQLGSRNRRLEALRLVRAARTFVTSATNAGVALSGSDVPRHLPVWETLLR